MTKLETSYFSATPGTDLRAADSAFNPWPGTDARLTFFENEEVTSLLKRGLFYARAGVPIHFQGTAGRGKTALALEIARRLGRKTALLAGHDWLDVQDLVGREVGQTESSLVDKYVQRVRRSESQTRYDWSESILARAMRQGQTLIYDEFTRGSAKANSILLSVLEEGVLIVTDRIAGQDMIRAHPDFRIILTSNPQDYAGVNAAPDALTDRMVTFQLNGFSARTEAGIVAARTGVSDALALRIVHLVRDLFPQTAHPERCSMRAAIMIGRITALRLRSASLSDALLSQISADVLNGRGAELTTGDIARYLADRPASPMEASP